MKCQKCGYPLPADSEFCQYCGARIESQPAAKTVQEESLMSKAYNSYISNTPEEKRLFEELLGSEELKAAYLEECKRNQKEYDSGTRISWKQSYLDFMGILHDKYFNSAPEPHPPKTAPEFRIKSTVQAAPPEVENRRTAQINENYMFCKKCGSIVDQTTKRCTDCGKQYFRAKNNVAAILLSLLLISSIGLNVMLYRQEIVTQKELMTVQVEKAKLEADYKSLDKQADSLKREKIAAEVRLTIVQDDLDWFEEHIGIIVSGVKNYHNIDCPKIKDSDSWYLHNTEYCEYTLNYARCPDCW